MSNYVESLLGKIPDAGLQTALREEVAKLRDRKEFGLVFERHLPESVRLYGQAVKRGTTVQFRSAPDDGLWYVVKISKGVAALNRRDGEEPQTQSAPVEDLVVVRRFGTPIYPGLVSVEEVRRGGDKPSHTVINSENYHALQMLRYAHERQVDVIYIDPPYNTGAQDWKYNNNYVDDADQWRHSKWLSFMERRLVQARELLKDDGVLIITIDENEVHHLALLLERMFPGVLRQMVTITINPSGASGDGLSRVEEYALFCFLGGRQPNRTADDMLAGPADAVAAIEGDNEPVQKVEWESLLRRGNAWYRAKRANLCYPVILNEDGTRILDAGEPFVGDEDASRPLFQDGKPLAWPVRKDGRLGIWRVDGKKLRALNEKGYAYVASRDDARGTWAMKYLMSGTVKAIDDGTIKVTGTGPKGEVLVVHTLAKRTIAKTVWRRSRHTAGGAGGTQLVSALLREKGAFSFPKSVYAVRDCLEIAVGDRKDALVLDFFGGSGTTLHATALLNQADGGRRRAIVVTNNEVDVETAAALKAAGTYPGDADYERNGIFWRATKPRCEAALTGLTPDGEPVEGDYEDGRSYSEGFAENAAFFELAYLDRDHVSLGRAFQAIAPLLWMKAGATGTRIDKIDGAWSLPEGAQYGVLFDTSGWRDFVAAVAGRDEIRHVFVVTDSTAVFQQVNSELRAGVEATALYEDYLSTFEINTGHAL